MDTTRTSITRRAPLRTECPECGAPAGERCYGVRPERNGKPWRRKSFHHQRWNAVGVYYPERYV